MKVKAALLFAVVSGCQSSITSPETINIDDVNIDNVNIDGTEDDDTGAEQASVVASSFELASNNIISAAGPSTTYRVELPNGQYGTAYYALYENVEDELEASSAFALANNGDDLQTAPDAGHVTYDVDYEMIYATGIAPTENMPNATEAGYGEIVEGTLSLVADFDNNLVTGSDMQVSATNGAEQGIAISGVIGAQGETSQLDIIRDLGGSVTATLIEPGAGTSVNVITVDGLLDGTIGGLGVVGAFHGNNGSDATFAGGFVGVAQPPGL